MPLKRVLLAACLFAAPACAGEKQPEQQPPPPAKQTGPVGPAVPSLSAAQRLTVSQYRNAIRDLFGPEVKVPPALEPDVSIEGLESVGASKSTISARGIEQYEAAALSIGTQVIADPALLDRVLTCKPVSIGDQECAKTFVSTLGRRAWRRPLTADEVNKTLEIIMSSSLTFVSFQKGLVYGISALLQSPNFLYRPAVGEDDPARPGNKRYTGYELATRLSFFLWNSIPDDALLEAAQSGGLGTYEGVSKEVDRMLASPKARDGLRNFVTQWLRLGDLDDLSKDAKLFTTFNVELGPMAREETLRLFEDIVMDRDGDVREVLTTRRTFVTPKLAAMYQLPAPSASGFAPITMPESSPRRGILGQIAILALNAHPTSSSATLRGKFIREKFLCTEIPAPPVNVNTALPEPTPDAKTLRQRVKVHLTEPSCAGCHKIMDPIGLGLENFDGIGRYRATENGATIDPAGDLDGARFNNPVELAKALHDHAELPWCITRKVYQYAMGHKPADTESATVDALTARFKSDGYRLKALIAAVATSPAFRAMGAPH